ncbi:hypothetical protein WMY93_028397 [Mugilogobius chulae]|uniref:PiggyBac transposable element-derived protein domain-containing protein n=1 Tax=Mugilogobius chulae TaxID=88201 RepID=A0AAW0MUY4_9GOBI
MSDAQIKTEDDIKQEPEDEEITHKRRRKTASPSTSADGEASRGTQTSPEKTPTAGFKVALRTRKRKKAIKTESEDEEDGWWSAENEDCNVNDPDYFEEENGGYSDASDDDTGLCKTANGAVNGAETGAEEGDSGAQQSKWKSRSAPDTQPPPMRFKPARTPGPDLDRFASWTPLSVFQLFFSNSILRKIVEYTNKNANKRKQAGQKRKWEPMTVKDLYIYLTTVLFSSLVKLHKPADYWRRAWPLCDPDEDEKNEAKRDTPEYDKLLKVKLLFNDMVNSCKSNFHPHKNICINERMIVKNKPMKCGYRLFALADSQTGYTWNLYIYTGKTAETRGQSAGYNAVMNLLPVSLLGTGYTLYTDSLFSSPRLFKELKEKHIGCCGMLSKNHPEFPQNTTNDFPSPASRGDIRWMRKDRLLFVKWMDTREVSMCSTVHEAFTGQVMKRPVREAKGMVAKQFSCPDAVADFNRHMIVVDKKDFAYQSITHERMGKKWHDTMFYYLLDIAVLNSYVLYKELGKWRGDDEIKTMSQKEFREELCRDMFKFGTGRETTSFAGLKAPPASLTCMPEHFSDEGARKHCRWCHTNGRKRVKTPVFCRRCLVPLCLFTQRNCFTEYHDALGAKRVEAE